MERLESSERNEMFKKQESYSFLNYGVMESFIKKGFFDLVDEATYKFLDIIQASIYWKDLRGRYLGCNQYLVEKIGGLKHRDEILGKKDGECPWFEFADEFQRIDQQVIQEQKVFMFEECLKNAAGELRYFLSIKQPLYNKNRKILGIVGNPIDITDLKKSETKAIFEEKKKRKRRKISRMKKFFGKLLCNTPEHFLMI